MQRLDQRNVIKCSVLVICRSKASGIRTYVHFPSSQCSKYHSSASQIFYVRVGEIFRLTKLWCAHKKLNFAFTCSTADEGAQISFQYQCW